MNNTITRDQRVKILKEVLKKSLTRDHTCEYCGTKIEAGYCQECDDTAHDMGIDLYN